METVINNFSYNFAIHITYNRIFLLVSFLYILQTIIIITTNNIKISPVNKINHSIKVVSQLNG